ncbi:hypothetical protein [Streptomyces regalis]|nr:hypothetical protein [Streptomyces regalis]
MSGRRRTIATPTRQPGGTGRWVTLAVADRDDENQPRLFVAVTDIDPV